ncbi:SOS response-associated peptidase [Kribbella sp. NPDC050241]|uniref:SOS response-associated peptidase n=1 Tax=Kribbella sp. NPDC050241 TaxID=3364115 RepID=UPI0037A840F4
MCGRYASTARRADLLEQFQLDGDNADELKDPDYNVAPTKTAPVVIARAPSDGPRDADAVRQLRLFKWGLVPFWAKDSKIGNRMVNARSETVDEKPAYKAAFKSRRCLIPVDAFYEWFETDKISEKTKKPLKQPFAFRPTDGSSLALAGLYEVWKDKSLAEDDPAALLWSYTILTTTATDEIGRIHDRIPMAIAPDDWEQWLDPTVKDPADVKALMGPPTGLEIYAVSTAVNDVRRNNGPYPLDPLQRGSGYRRYHRAALEALADRGAAISIGEAAGIIGRSRTAVRDLIAAGELRSSSNATFPVFRRDVERYAESHPQPEIVPGN